MRTFSSSLVLPLQSWEQDTQSKLVKIGQRHDQREEYGYTISPKAAAEEEHLE